MAQGKTVKLLLAGRKGRAAFVRTHRDAILDTLDLVHGKAQAFADAQGIAQNVIDRYTRGEFDVAELFFSTFRSPLVQEPTRVQLIPAALPEAKPDAARPRPPPARRPRRSSTSPTRNRSLPTCCRETSPSRSSAPCSKTRRASSARR